MALDRQQTAGWLMAEDAIEHGWHANRSSDIGTNAKQ